MRIVRGGLAGLVIVALTLAASITYRKTGQLDRSIELYDMPWGS